MTAPEIISTLIKLVIYMVAFGIAFRLGRRDERRRVVARLRNSQWGVDRRRGRTVEDTVRARWDWGVDALVDEIEGKR